LYLLPCTTKEFRNFNWAIGRLTHTVYMTMKEVMFLAKTNHMLLACN
jgi:hypothetical protein